MLDLRKVLKLKNVPPEIINNNLYLYGQIHNTHLGLIVVMGILLIYLFSYLLMSSMILAIILTVNFIIVLSLYIFFIKDPVKRKSIASNMTILMLVSTAYPIVLLTGGIESSTLIWFSLFPAVMVFMNGIKNAAIWFFLSTFVFISLYLLPDIRITNALIIPGSRVERFIDTIIMTFTATLIISVVDISKKRTLKRLEKTQSKLRILATTDPLTGLFNRRFFLERAEAEINRSIRYGIPLTLLMVDIDRFKRINDSFGHKAGDKVLEEVSNIFRKSLRDIDLIGRYGGEEFIILLPESDRDSSSIVAERIRNDIENAVILINGESIKITISIGAAELLADSKCSLDTLTLRADEALYLSKERGRNRVTVWDKD